MAILKCKMCGGSIDYDGESTVIECEFCGTKQTAPKSCSIEVHELFNRANNLRSKGEFDRAEKIYEKIVTSAPDQAEAYWGLVLCRYGIEYVDDPTSFRKIPTCHRVAYESVVSDSDYQSALDNADIMQKIIYEEQAKEIDKVQKDILARSQKEKPYDVFICYKETDFNGQRTVDSVIANDIYHQLTQEGLNVFYAAITLESKLGQEYEPVIFAALNSAKVMLVIGTNPEYFNAVWVKNEWSRFLKIIKNDRSKLLIPCYRNMDPYDLPDEFAHLQAQDMNRVGFMVDIIRGIKKLTQSTTTVTPQQAAPANTAHTVSQNFDQTQNLSNIPRNVAPLLQRAYMFLEDKDWANAARYCETILDMEPQNAEAYLYKLMAALHVSQKHEIPLQSQPLSEIDAYHKILRFASPELIGELTEYNDSILKKIRHEKNEKIYDQAHKTMNSAYYKHDYQKAADLFMSISDFKDSQDLALYCSEKAEHAITKEMAELQNNIYAKAVKLSKYKNAKNHKEALRLFSQIPDWKDSADYIASIKADQLKLEQYENKIAENRKYNLKVLTVTFALQAIITLLSIFIRGIISSEVNDEGFIISTIDSIFIFIIFGSFLGPLPILVCQTISLLSQKNSGTVCTILTRIFSCCYTMMNLIFVLGTISEIKTDPTSFDLFVMCIAFILIDIIAFAAPFFKKKAKKDPSLLKC